MVRAHSTCQELHVVRNICDCRRPVEHPLQRINGPFSSGNDYSCVGDVARSEFHRAQRTATTPPIFMVPDAHECVQRRDIDAHPHQFQLLVRWKAWSNSALAVFFVRSNRNGRFLLMVPLIIERKGARLLDLKASVFFKFCSIEHNKNSHEA